MNEAMFLPWHRRKWVRRLEIAICVVLVVFLMYRVQTGVKKLAVPEGDRASTIQRCETLAVEKAEEIVAPGHKLKANVRSLDRTNVLRPDDGYVCDVEVTVSGDDPRQLHFSAVVHPGKPDEDGAVFGR